jgi:hypothetical protein
MLVSFLRLSEVFRRPYVPLVNLERGLAFSPTPLQRTDGPVLAAKRKTISV